MYIENTTPAADLEFDREFRERLLSHDNEALARFFDSYFDWVFTRVHRRIRNRQMAEDLTQDIFLKIHKGLPRFDADKSLKPWVLTILNNHLRDHWRSQATQRTQQGIEEISESLPSLTVENDNSLERSETEASLRRAIYKLPMAMRSVLLLRTYDELSFVQIARLLEVTPGAARKRYSRAIGELRDILPKRGLDARYALSA